MSNAIPHVLLVDDHRDIRQPLTQYLDKNGCRVTAAADAAEARQILRAAAPDIAIIDIMMPGEDGLSLCRHVVEATDTPVILLTAKAEDTDRIVGLEIGADDYVTKPFNPRELLARIKAVLRRSNAMPRQNDHPLSSRIEFDRWVLDTAKRELVDPKGVVVALSTADFRLLNVFLQRPGMVLSRDQLLDLTVGREADPFDRSIDNQVSRLRRKIEEDAAHPVIIQTVWGAGYKFTADVTAA